MHSRAIELQQRAARFVADVERLLKQIPDAMTARKLATTITTATTAMQTGYREACASSSPEEFIKRIALVTRKAKRVKASLVLLVELDHLNIDGARETILEARALEAIFTASRNTARRRQRGRLVSRRNPSERTAQAADGKPARRRRNPPGVT
jgi:four helix bundle protein